MTWREYHEATKHSIESLRRSAHSLDWANMPDPFRHYEGVPLLDLPADPPPPESASSPPDGAAFLSQLLFYSAAISAAKRVPSTGYKYALRVNPSSGNLHPTEFHFITRGLKDWPDGLYHYRVSSHMAEQRARGEFTSKPGVTFFLTTIAWREAWKYQDRAYRYCLHDVGHAWQALASAARAMGCESRAIWQFPDDEVAQTLRLSPDEWPMLIIELEGKSIPTGAPDAAEIVWFGGEANRLSEEITEYPLIEAVHQATKVVRSGMPEPAPSVAGEIKLPPPAVSNRPFGEITRRRRSALDFQGGNRSISLPQLAAILPRDEEIFIRLYIYSHRVDGLEPGVYRYWADGGTLELIRPGDQRAAAAGLSLGQELAGNACLAFSMVADLDRASRAYGDRGYRFAHFEAGAIGQKLYLAAEALGLQATGIGAFFDDRVHNYLELSPEQGQVIYHFAVGYAVHDPRLEA